jgi:uncharacterized repeat protein (TIGR02543 family)
VTIVANTTVTANFSQNTYTLTVVSAHGTVTRAPNNPTYTYGQTVLLTMSSVEPGWTFTGWSGGGCSGIAPCTVTMTANTTVTANFSQIFYLLTVSKTGNGSGTVTSTPAGINCGVDCSESYTYNTLVTLNPLAASGSTFTGWSGACLGIGACQVTMSEARSVTARFTLNTISILDAVIQEGDSGTLGISFTVRTSVPPGAQVSVHYATSGGSAAAGLDYETATGTVTFVPGDQNETITVQVRGDFLDEEDESFNVILSDPVEAIIVDGTGLGTIQDNDGPPDMTIVPAIDFYEGDIGVVNAVFTLTLSTASGKTAAVHFETEDGTARGGDPITQGIDYLQMSAQVIFSPGEILKRITIPINPDDLCETQENFYLNLSEVENANLRLARSRATINNDDLCYAFLPAINRYDWIFVDYFNSETGWEEVPESQSDWFILNGEYHGKHVVIDRNAKAIAPLTVDQLNGSYAIEADVRSVAGSENDGRAGLLFDYHDNNATYRFVIIPRATSGPNWLVQVRNTALSRWDSLASGTNFVHIHAGDGVNVLRVERDETQIRAYVNDYLLWEGTDSTFLSGQVGLIVGTPTNLAPGKSIEFAFDTFIVDKLP